MSETVKKFLIVFEIPGAPVAKARPIVFSRNNKTCAFTPKKSRQAEYNIKNFLVCNKAPKFEGPVFVKMIFGLERPKTIKRDYPIVRGPKSSDIDNYVKTVLDSMNEICFDDDNQVVKIEAEKFYSDKPSTIIQYGCA